MICSTSLWYGDVKVSCEFPPWGLWDKKWEISGFRFMDWGKAERKKTSFFSPFSGTLAKLFFLQQLRAAEPRAPPLPAPAKRPRPCGKVNEVRTAAPKYKYLKFVFLIPHYGSCSLAASCSNLLAKARAPSASPVPPALPPGFPRAPWATSHPPPAAPPSVTERTRSPQEDTQFSLPRNRRCWNILSSSFRAPRPCGMVSPLQGDAPRCLSALREPALLQGSSSVVEQSGDVVTSPLSEVYPCWTPSGGRWTCSSWTLGNLSSLQLSPSSSLLCHRAVSTLLTQWGTKPLLLGVAAWSRSVCWTVGNREGDSCISSCRSQHEVNKFTSAVVPDGDGMKRLWSALGDAGFGAPGFWAALGAPSGLEKQK